MRPSSSLPGMRTPRSQMRFWSNSSSFSEGHGAGCEEGCSGVPGGGSCRSTAFILSQAGRILRLSGFKPSARASCYGANYRIMRRAAFILIPFAAAAQSFLSGGLSRFAGLDTSQLTGDGGPAYYATFQGANALARDPAGNFYIGEIARIRKIDTHGVITTIAGTGVPGETGDGGPATSAQVNFVTG